MQKVVLPTFRARVALKGQQTTFYILRSGNVLRGNVLRGNVVRGNVLRYHVVIRCLVCLVFMLRVVPFCLLCSWGGHTPPSMHSIIKDKDMFYIHGHNHAQHPKANFAMFHMLFL